MEEIAVINSFWLKGAAMNKSFYRAIIITTLVVGFISGFMAFYSVGVIDRANTRELLESRINQVSEILDSNVDEYKKITEQIYANYKSKSRVTAIMLSKNKSIMTDDTTFEELRMAIGADSVSITDSSGMVEYSTSPADENQKALKDFLPAIENKVFSEAVLNTEYGKTQVITGCSRLDAPGIIQIEFTPENSEALLDLTDISRTLTEIPVLKNGHMAIIEAESGKYLSHTNSELIGSQSIFTEDDFDDEKGWFSSEFEGQDVMVKYLVHDDKIIIGMVSYDEIYSRRNSIVKWIIFAVTVTSAVITLTIRSKIIKNKNRED